MHIVLTLNYCIYTVSITAWTVLSNLLSISIYSLILGCFTPGENWCPEWIKEDISLLTFSISLCLSHPSMERVSGAICRPRSIPKHWGSQRCYFSKLALSTSCRGCAAVVQGKVGNFWGPVPPAPPSLSPASSGAALWGCHNCGLYNMGYCWRRLVTVDEAFKEASPLMVSVKILESLAPRQLQMPWWKGCRAAGLHFGLWWVEGAPRPCLGRMPFTAFQLCTTAFSSPSKNWNHPLHFSFMPLCMQVACTKWVLHVLSCAAVSISQNQMEITIYEDCKICCK